MMSCEIARPTADSGSLSSYNARYIALLEDGEPQTVRAACRDNERLLKTRTRLRRATGNAVLKMAVSTAKRRPHERIGFVQTGREGRAGDRRLARVGIADGARTRPVGRAGGDQRPQTTRTRSGRGRAA